MDKTPPIIVTKDFFDKEKNPPTDDKILEMAKGLYDKMIQDKQKERKIKLLSLLYNYFEINDTYTYILTRDKSGFGLGTITSDDFDELTETDIENLVDYILENI